MSVFKYGMLIFCRQIQRSACLIYCVELDTLDDVSPRIHRFRVGIKRFAAMALGEVYRLEIRGTRVVNAIPEGAVELGEADYELLVELRFRRFGEAGLGGEFCMRNYFSFAELVSLYDYREPLWERFSLFLMRMLLYLIGGLTPIALYVALLYNCFTDKTRVYSGLIMSLGALPFMVYLLVLLYTLCGVLLMEWGETRYGMLRSFALRNCGLKRRPGVSKKAARKLLFGGIATFAVFALCSILAILI